MLDSVARYHGLNKSATLASLVRKEFWRVFPRGTGKIKPDRGLKSNVTNEPQAINPSTFSMARNCGF
jgi:hypothetical protein